jgi:hypothetical protein
MSVNFNIYNIFDTIENITYESLLDYFITNYNKQIFVKKISDDLVLIHNSFNCPKLERIPLALYNECRSIIVQTGIEPHPKVVSYTHDNIEYMKVSDQLIEENPLNRYEESYEGTLISVFNHLGKWYFCTSRCGSIDSSYFYDKTRSFGHLFDECLKNMNVESREDFTSKLDTNICYYFVLVHHENKSIVSYTSRFGEQYKKLVFAFARDKSTQQIVQVELDQNLKEGLVMPRTFETLEMGKDFLAVEMDTEGLLIKQLNEDTGKTQFIKVHTDKHWLEKSHTPNYPNKWFAYLDIYKKNDVTFRIEDYQKEKNIVETLEINNKKVDITGMIYLLYQESSDIMFNIVMHFTKFNYSLNNFEKTNSQDYEKLKQGKYSVLRKQLSVLQGLVLKQILKSSGDVVNHLRKHLTVEDFIGLLKCLQSLIKDKVSYIKFKNHNYLVFLDFYLDKLN